MGAIYRPAIPGAPSPHPSLNPQGTVALPINYLLF